MTSAQCPKCSSPFTLDETILSHSDAVVQCLQCHTRFRLQINNRQPSPTDTALSGNDSEADLIDQVDALIDQKIIRNDTTETISSSFIEYHSSSNSKEPQQESTLDKFFRSQLDSSDEFDPQRLMQPQTQRTFSDYLLGSALTLLIVILVLLMIYQMWFKLILPLDNSPKLAKLMTQAVDVSNQQLRPYGLSLPKRRNLKALTLVTVNVEPHPTRASTVLLRLSLLNNAAFAQPLPWLELSLTRFDGRIIARRQLDPAAYLHNNRNTNQIESKQLQKITVELLSFPKQATGYELKIVDS